MSSIVPVVLSGGAGTRLWPLSRRNEPKQFQSLTGDESMLELTLARVASHRDRALIMGSAAHVDALAAQADGVRIVAEPAARNTAPAVAAAALLADAADILVVMPADHHLADQEAFGRALDQAIGAAEDGFLTTFGIVPNRPETGYGYIVAEDGEKTGYRRIARFVEKPDQARAQSLVDEGAYWNSGMFVFPTQLILDELERLQPDVLESVQASLDAATTHPWGIALSEEFTLAPSVSIDTAVMEQTPNAAVVPLDAGWSDIGSWATLWELGKKDAAGNVIAGPVTAIGATSNYLRSEGPRVAVSGVDGLVVVATPEAVLVTKREDAQSVKAVVELLGAEDR